MVQAHAEFKRKPVNGTEPLQLQLAGAERGEADLLAKVCKVLVGEHRRMAYQLVNNIGLRSVLRRRMMPDVLRRVEDSECKAVEELSLGQ